MSKDLKYGLPVLRKLFKVSSDGTRVEIPRHPGQVVPLNPDETLELEETWVGKKHDQGKLRFDLIPDVVVRELARILTYGSKKYADDSWQQVDPFTPRYYAALCRHLSAWRLGEGIDPESGLHHLSHALCNLAFLVWKEVK